MSKKNNGRRPAVRPADRIAVQDELAELLVRFRGKELHYYNFIGNNDDGLMHALGCSPMAHGAIMCSANVFGLRKARGKKCPVCFT